MGVISLDVVWLSQKKTLAGVSVIEARSNLYATQPSNLPHIFEYESIFAGSRVFFSDNRRAASYIPALKPWYTACTNEHNFCVIIFFIYKP